VLPPVPVTMMLGGLRSGRAAIGSYLDALKDAGFVDAKGKVQESVEEGAQDTRCNSGPFQRSPSASEGSPPQARRETGR